MSFFQPIYAFLHSPAGVIGLFAALLVGFWLLYRRPAGNTSQRLMRWRIGLQFAAICLILGIAILNQ